MAGLVYCKVCKATFPLTIVRVQGGRSAKVKEAACPMGHSAIEELPSSGMPLEQK